jgi:hypothetical protein
VNALWIWRVLVIIGILAIAGELAGIRKELAGISALVAQLRTELAEDDDDAPPARCCRLEDKMSAVSKPKREPLLADKC